MGFQKPPIGAKLNYGHPLAKGLIGCWLFNEMSGNKVFDYSGQSKHGTITNSPVQTAVSGWSAGPHGGERAFDGSDDYVDIIGGIDLANSEFTIITSIKTSTFGSRMFLSVGSVAATDKLLHFRLLSATSFLFGMYGDDLTVNLTNMSNKQTHIAATLTTERLQNVYQDGINSGSRTAGGMFSGNTTCPIGTGNTGSGWEWYSGRMSFLFIYKRALSAAEIAHHCAFPFCMFDIQFQNYWGVEPPPPSIFIPRITMIL